MVISGFPLEFVNPRISSSPVIITGLHARSLTLFDCEPAISKTAWTPTWSWSTPRRCSTRTSTTSGRTSVSCCIASETASQMSRRWTRRKQKVQASICRALAYVCSSRIFYGREENVHQWWPLFIRKQISLQSHSRHSDFVVRRLLHII